MGGGGLEVLAKCINTECASIWAFSALISDSEP